MLEASASLGAVDAVASSEEGCVEEVVCGVGSAGAGATGPGEDRNCLYALSRRDTKVSTSA